MATLTYDFAVVGQQNVKRALTSMERLFVAHDQKMRARFGKAPPGSPATGSHVGGYRSSATAAVAARTGERKRHAEAMGHVSSEERARIRAEHRIHRIARRNQLRRARASRREREREEREAARAAQASRRRFRSATVGAVTRTGSSVVGVGRMGLTAASLYGGFAMAGALDASMRGDRAKRDLANQAFGQMNNASREELLSRISATTKPLALQTGRSEEEIAGMMGLFHAKAGGLQQAIDMAPFLSELADASGSDMADIGEAAGSVFAAAVAQGMNEADAGQAVRDMMSAMAGQAKEGSIELKDLADLMGRIVSSGGKFKGTFADVSSTMGAFAQIALAGGASSANEATTAVMRFGPDLAKRTKKFKKAGVNIWADKGKTQLRDPGELLMETVAKTKGNQAVMTGLFGEESAKIVDAFSGAYNKAGGGAKGEEAMRAMLAKYLNLSMTREEVSTSAAFSRQGLDTRLGRVRERFNDKLGPAAERVVMRLIPALEKMIPYIEKAADKLAAFIEWLSDNPGKGIGLLIGAALTKEIAAAGIAGLIRSFVEGTLTGKGPGGKGGGPSLVGGAGPMLGAAATYGGWKYGEHFLAEDFRRMGMSDDSAETAGGIKGAALLMSGGPLGLLGDYLGRAAGEWTADKLGLRPQEAQAGLTPGAKALQDAANGHVSVTQMYANVANQLSASADQLAASATALAASNKDRGFSVNRGDGPR